MSDDDDDDDDLNMNNGRHTLVHSNIWTLI